MAVLETLRQKAGVLLVAVIGIALLSFVLGDMFSGKYGGMTSRDVGKIGGSTIGVEEYMQKVDSYADIYRVMYGEARGTEMLAEQGREMAWEELIQEIVFQDEYNRLGVVVGSDELFDLIQGRNPSPAIVQNFTNPETGEFNRADVLRFLQNLDNNPNPDAKIFWLFLEKEIAKERLHAKVINLLAKSTYVTKADAKAALQASGNAVDIKYLVKKYEDVPDSTVSVSDADIKAYYKEHKNKYKQTETRDIEYVSIAIEPSTTDDEAAKDWVKNLEQPLSQAKDAMQFATLNSNAQVDNRYYSKKELTGDIAAFVATASATDVMPAYRDGDVYAITRIAHVKMLPDSVKASHILLKPQVSWDATRKLADSIKNALKAGANFAALSKKYSDDKAADAQGGDLGWFGQTAMVQPFADSCFNANKGAFFVVETQFGIHVVKLVDKGALVQKMQLATIKRNIEPSRTTRESIYARANAIASQSANREAFAKNVAEAKVDKQIASRISINDKNVQSLQGARDLVKWAYEADKNDVSPVFEIDNKFVVATLTTVREDGFAPVKDVAMEIRAELLKNKKTEMLAQQITKTQKDNVDAVAAELGVTVGTSSNITFSSFYLPGLGVEPHVAAVASVSKQDVLSQAITGMSGSYVLQVTKSNLVNVDEPAINQERQRMQGAAGQRVNNEFSDALKQSADIKDWRGRWIF